MAEAHFVQRSQSVGAKKNTLRELKKIKYFWPSLLITLSCIGKLGGIHTIHRNTIQLGNTHTILRAKSARIRAMGNWEDTILSVRAKTQEHRPPPFHE